MELNYPKRFDTTRWSAQMKTNYDLVTYPIILLRYCVDVGSYIAHLRKECQLGWDWRSSIRGASMIIISITITMTKQISITNTIIKHILKTITIILLTWKWSVKIGAALTLIFQNTDGQLFESFNRKKIVPDKQDFFRFVETKNAIFRSQFPPISRWKC